MSHRIRCAIYTRKSSEEGLEQSFNSLDAQREACEAYIKSQQHEGWQRIPTRYDDGGFSGWQPGAPCTQAAHGRYPSRQTRGLFGATLQCRNHARTGKLPKREYCLLNFQIKGRTLGWIGNQIQSQPRLGGLYHRYDLAA